MAAKVQLNLAVPEIDGNGHQSISVQLVEASINERGLYEGGKFLIFMNDHVRQRVEIGAYHFQNGGFRYDKTLKKIPDEVFTPGECLAWAEQHEGG